MNNFFERALGPCAGALIILSIPQKNPVIEVDWFSLALGLAMLAMYAINQIKRDE